MIRQKKKKTQLVIVKFRFLYGLYKWEITYWTDRTWLCFYWAKVFSLLLYNLSFLVLKTGLFECVYSWIKLMWCVLYVQKTPPIRGLMCYPQHWSYHCFSSSSSCWRSTVWGECTYAVVSSFLLHERISALSFPPFLPRSLFLVYVCAWACVLGLGHRGGGAGGLETGGRQWLMGKQLHLK